MDFDRLIDAVNAFTEDVKRSLDAHNSEDFQRELAHDAMRKVSTVQAISRALSDGPDPDLFLFQPEDWSGRHDALNAAMRLEGALLFRRDLADAVEDARPSFNAERLHSWVWESAATLWRDGHHRQAILAAAVQIELHLQAKIGRYDVSGAKLVREAFSSDAPKPGRSRLRFDDFPEGSETSISVHEGAREFGAGCTQLIRNTAAHTTRRLSEDVALEHLASLSLYARLIDRAQVARAPEGGGGTT